ncbi:hypothetical protein VM1G_11198 [Cytospora mali]|uniref:Tse2 ADP-ribosyltransferase toxin domain-containing protein n=1 Tax=Cytospora mali TaxID=578113 RepID=A0A194VJT0_CYTMA|nr:hypothetical protein VM1G_11198 [Valsa mali]
MAMAMARPLFRGLMRRQPPMARPHSFAGVLAQQFHTTATNLTSISPPIPKKLHAEIKSIYTDSFPYTLYFYNTRGPKLALCHYDRQMDERGDWHHRHGSHVIVNKDGLVDPEDPSRINGIPMFPNTILQYEILRLNWEWAENLKEEGQDLPPPWIFTIPKG